MSHVLSKIAFAKLKRVNRSTVTRWGKAGRLVLAQNGKVLVDQTNTLLEKTQGSRSDLTEKHAKNRQQLVVQQVIQVETQIEGEVEQAYIDLNGKSRQDYRAMEIDAKNGIRKLKKALATGIVLDKQQFREKIAKEGNNIKNAIERLIDNLAPQLANTIDRAGVKTKIEQEIQKLKLEIS